MGVNLWFTKQLIALRGPSCWTDFSDLGDLSLVDG